MLIFADGPAWGLNSLLFHFLLSMSYCLVQNNREVLVCFTYCSTSHCLTSLLYLSTVLPHSISKKKLVLSLLIPFLPPK